MFTGLKRDPNTPISKEMERASRLRAGHLMSLAGALAAVASPWLPWYRASLGPAFAQAVQQQAAQILSPMYAGLVTTAAGLLPPSITASGFHTATHSGPKISLIVLALGAVCVAAIFTEARDTAVPLVGLAIAGLMAWHLFVDRWVSRVPGISIHATYGAYVALGAGVAIVAGGLIAALESPSEDATASEAWGSTPADPSARALSSEVRPASVAPPGF